MNFTTDTVASMSSAEGYSNFSCKGMNVTSIGNKGVSRGIVYLGPGTVIEDLPEEAHCTTRNAVKTSLVNNGDTVTIRTEEWSRNGASPASHSSELRMGDIRISSSGCIGSGVTSSLSRSQTVHNIRTGSTERSIHHICSNPYQHRSISDVQSSSGYHYQFKSSDNEVTGKMMGFVSCNVGSDWRALGSKIGFSFEELDLFHLDYGHSGVEEICYQMLSSWKQRRGSSATTDALSRALTDIDRNDIARRLLS